MRNRWFHARFDDVEMMVLKIAGYLPLHAARRYLIRIFGGSVSGTATLYHGFEIRSARKLQISARTSIGNGAVLDARGGLRIGSDVNVSTSVQIWTAQHAWNDVDFSYVTGPVSIGDRAWISARATILPGVKIGEGAVVAAGSVVTKDVPAFCLVAGVPAKVVGERRSDLRYQLPPARRKSWWW